MASIIVLVVCSFLFGILCTVVTIGYRVCTVIYGSDNTLKLTVQFLIGMTIESIKDYRRHHHVQGRR